MSTVYPKQSIVHSPEHTVIAAQTIIVRRRRRKQITALEARRAWTAIECEDDDGLEAQIGTILSYPRVFGRQYWTVVRGAAIGPALWRDALETFVRETRAKNGALRNEPLPIYAENSLAMFLRDAS
ncbi:hypothetical protein [Paraburkholderia sp. SIMBA_053]|uniref:hypothetical protein n=1 Tax=Paraburkholderia sp. SIMBA_053 TaxID=3085794 RepID=UPI0039784A4B